MSSNPVSISVLIPNYNYGRYIGSTIESVLSQEADGLEIVVSDNHSTDDSAEVVRGFQDDRIKLHVNPCNVGFAPNLERVAAMASGRRMLLLSSDDRMKEGALAAYRRLEEALGDRAERAVWGSTTALIDSDGKTTGEMPADPKLWRDAAVDEALTRAVGFTVRSMPAEKMLKRSLQLLRIALPFATTCYPKSLHDDVGGYSGGRLINPDKWFLWKLLAVAETIYVIDHPLFEYRIHNAGQAAQEQRSGALKHLTDQYIATFNLPDNVLARAGVDRDALASAFIEQDIAMRGLLSLAQGQRRTARRTVQFGLAAYPDVVRGNPKVWLLRGLLALGPVGSTLARLARTRAEQRWRERESGVS